MKIFRFTTHVSRDVCLLGHYKPKHKLPGNLSHIKSNRNMSSGFVDEERSGLPKGFGLFPTGHLCYASTYGRRIFYFNI